MTLGLLRPPRALGALLLSALLLPIGVVLASPRPHDTCCPWRPQEGSELIGTEAPKWQEIQWVQGGPLSLADLRGRVVLLRFLLIGCPYCSTTLPVLEQLSERYAEKGLVVVGLHHPAGEGSSDPHGVEQFIKRLGIHFSIGHDGTWSTTEAYGVRTVFGSFSSVSFLIDREGRIRFVHDGGEYHLGEGGEHLSDHSPCNNAYDALLAAIESALAEPAPPTLRKSSSSVRSRKSSNRSTRR